MPITPTAKIWMDGTLVDWDDANVHVLSHTLHYGLGAFEGIRAYKTPNGVAVFRLKEHMQRLLNSCKILDLEIPYSLKDLCEATKELVRVNELNEGCYIRPIVFLGYGEIGVNPIGSPVQTAIAAWTLLSSAILSPNSRTLQSNAPTTPPNHSSKLRSPGSRSCPAAASKK